MKKLLITISFAFGFLHSAEADSKAVSSEMRVCRFLERLLDFQINHEKRELPTSWETFDVIGLMKKNPLKQQLFESRVVNSFALVPDTPLIQPQPGISPDYLGHRLFLISREQNITKSAGNGRCVILIKPVELDSQPVRIYSDFIPEETAQIILKQIKGFDPQKQPLAFENIEQLERDKKARQVQSTQEIRRDLIGEGKLGPEYETPPDSHKSMWRVWIVAGIIFFAFLIWRAFPKHT